MPKYCINLLEVMVLSQRFRDAIKFPSERQYRLAQKCGLDPTTLSALIHGARKPHPDDGRLLKLAALLDVPFDEIVETDGTAVRLGNRS